MDRYYQPIRPDSSRASPTARGLAAVLSTTGRTLFRRGRDGWLVARGGRDDLARSFNTLREVRAFAELKVDPDLVRRVP